MKKILLFALILLLSACLFGCMNGSGGSQVKDETQQTDKTEEEVDPKVYQNTQYGFSFSLPESWKGYTIVIDEWEGMAIGGSKAIETGPLINIRHPKWTFANPRQDIPIMIFTLSQWDSLQQGKFHIGAAPIGPNELDRNSGYVFALPARYNYAFLTGWEEVENILNGDPLQPNEDINPDCQ